MEKVERKEEDLNLLKENINCFLDNEFGHTDENLFESSDIEQVAHTENEFGEELNVYVDIERLEVIKCTYYKNYYQEREGFDTLEELAEWLEGVDFGFLTSLNK
ncbi:hypothetical protein [Staphylococcus succinus]|uniref:hypothetical protein n=1 Tax=Staphylococcus succinus TaxID=61015 RepID=UPI000E6A8329|nr:hypothetical protein [Staphylococcus succinus]RIN27735.1 hypothetical protein BU067_01630 [Staphylococcus succinus]